MSSWKNKNLAKEGENSDVLVQAPSSHLFAKLAFLHSFETAGLKEIRAVVAKNSEEGRK